MAVGVESGRSVLRLSTVRAVLAVLEVILWAIGWLAAKIVLAILWIVEAVQLGWSDAHKGRSTKT